LPLIHLAARQEHFTQGLAGDTNCLDSQTPPHRASSANVGEVGQASGDSSVEETSSGNVTKLKTVFNQNAQNPGNLSLYIFHVADVVCCCGVCECARLILILLYENNFLCVFSRSLALFRSRA